MEAGVCGAAAQVWYLLHALSTVNKLCSLLVLQDEIAKIRKPKWTDRRWVVCWHNNELKHLIVLVAGLEQ
jgi:hypothetical protein